MLPRTVGGLSEIGSITNAHPHTARPIFHVSQKHCHIAINTNVPFNFGLTKNTVWRKTILLLVQSPSQRKYPTVRFLYTGKTCKHTQYCPITVEGQTLSHRSQHTNSMQHAKCNSYNKNKSISTRGETQQLGYNWQLTDIHYLHATNCPFVALPKAYSPTSACALFYLVHKSSHFSIF